MRRRSVESSLTSLVRDNRFTIAVIFPVVGAVVLLASARGWLPEPLAFNPALILFGTAVMRLPLIAGVLPVLDRRAGLALVVLAAYTWGIEMIGVATGYPYGTFEYGVSLGPMVEGVPLALPLFFIPLVFNAYLFALLVAPSSLERRWIRWPVAVGAVVAIDLVLDPAAVSIGFWAFEAEGMYYGVPLTNYLGWVLSATVAVAVVEVGFSRARLQQRVSDCEFILDDLVSFTLLWGTINLLYGNWIPVVVTVCFVGGLYSSGRFDVFPDRGSLPGRSGAEA